MNEQKRQFSAPRSWSGSRAGRGVLVQGGLSRSRRRGSQNVTSQLWLRLGSVIVTWGSCYFGQVLRDGRLLGKSAGRPPSQLCTEGWMLPSPPCRGRVLPGIAPGFWATRSVQGCRLLRHPPRGQAQLGHREPSLPKRGVTGAHAQVSVPFQDAKQKPFTEPSGGGPVWEAF